MSNPFVAEAIRCAGPGCTHVRRDVNHWFAVWEEGCGIADGPIIFMCAPLEPPLGPDGDMIKPACGAACAQKLFEQFLSK